MSCVKPLTAWQPVFANTPSGKSKPVFVNPHDTIRYREIQVACGQCIGCRLDYSREWATRIMCEAKCWRHNYFVTLTYDPEHVPMDAVVHLDTGEYVEGMTLWPDHLTQFMKNLRRYWSYHYGHDNIRFYACGEYGSLNERPHYHLVLFNFPLQEDQLQQWFLNSEHQPIYKCPVVESIWGKGMVAVGAVSYNSAAYVARYMLKKQKGPDAAAYYKSRAKLPEFSRMSRMPGIGKDYYDAHKEEIYAHDEMFQTTLKSGTMKVKPPKYYDRLYDLDSPEAMAAIKRDRRKAAERAAAAAQAKSTLYPEERNAIKERTLSDKSRKLLRCIE